MTNMPTADPLLLTKAAHALLPNIRDGLQYAKAGLMLTDLRPRGNESPLEVFEDRHEERHIGPLLEEVSRRFERDPSGWAMAGSKPVGTGL
ncbi:hypothetical protein QFZ40_001070 [Arthrobacter pascens]|nr:hypothetical protein [Arthrobacter pascens]